MIAWLSRGEAFPAVETALPKPNGLLAAGGDLSSSRLIQAYRLGIFPWFSRGEPILWWSPDPRMVLLPEQLKISRSLGKRLRQHEFQVKLDTRFSAIVAACAEPRRGQDGTWITPEMKSAYGRLHALGYAHSVETYRGGQLVGGLYGIALGRVFYGESMFSRETDASKVALAHLARFLEARGFSMIDCQMSTAHLASLGAREVPRAQFVAQLARLTGENDLPGHWPPEGATDLFGKPR